MTPALDAAYPARAVPVEADRRETEAMFTMTRGPFEHVPTDELGQREQPGQVRRDQVGELLRSLVLGRARVGGARVVHESVDVDEASQGGGDDTGAIGFPPRAPNRQGIVQPCGQDEIVVEPT
jgi:hypothetical protein